MAINLDHVTEQIQVTDNATNASLTVQSKGTGAFNVAAGSSGVNISNGGTVTAITRTANGSGYTGIPSVAISAPTTAGGVQATATASVFGNTATVVSGGAGYTLNDVVTLVGGAPVGLGATYTVTGVSGGVVTTVSPLNFQAYTAVPANPVSVTGGTGSGLTLTVTYGYQGATITNAGSGYVEQPTVTFSGGGGSGAAAYATVGSDTLIRSLGQNIAFTTPNGRTGFRVVDFGGATGTGHWNALGGTTGPQLRATGATSGIILTESAVPLSLQTGSTEQFRVNHTASAVNFLQVTGAATGGNPTISAQGSDANVNIRLTPKGSGQVQINSWMQVGVGAFNFIQLQAANSGSAPVFAVAGGDTNIDLALTTKGTGALTVNTGGGTQFRVVNTASAVNYFQANGSVTGVQPGFRAEGSDTNISTAFTTKGTGGHFFSTNSFAQTQLVVTHTASAVNYVQVTGAATGARPVISAQGSDSNVSFDLNVKGVGAIRLQSGNANIMRLNGVASAANFFDVFSSAAAASPRIVAEGSDTNIDINLTTKGTGAIRFNTGNGEQVRIIDSGVAATSFLNLRGGAGGCAVYPAGASSELSMGSSGGFNLRFFTQGQTNEQLRISNTTSAVNFVQVTGAVTGGRPIISAQGSDGSIGLTFTSKGTGIQAFNNGNGTQLVLQSGPASSVNRIEITPSATGVAPIIASGGNDTNIDLALTPKGTGNVRFGTYTGTALSIAGYIEIKDAGGTIRRLAVVA
jgi:hypothetical protein